MKSSILAPLFAAIPLVFQVSSVGAEGPEHWSYSGAQGPEHWSQLSTEFSACAGRNQSPINLTSFIEADLKPIHFSYHPGGTEIVNNGHTLQVNYVSGSSISVDGIQFELKQFHFHAPSENQIDGKSYPLEAHLVHADKDGNLAVVAVMLTTGEENKLLSKAWTMMPRSVGVKNLFTPPITAEDLLPASRDYYLFSGSLTTPPCSEGVRWMVMKNPVSVSSSQIEAFTKVIQHPNNRPVQPLFARAVLK